MEHGINHHHCEASRKRFAQYLYTWTGKGFYKVLRLICDAKEYYQIWFLKGWTWSFKLYLWYFNDHWPVCQPYFWRIFGLFRICLWRAYKIRSHIVQIFMVNWVRFGEIETAGFCTKPDLRCKLTWWKMLWMKPLTIFTK